VGQAGGLAAPFRGQWRIELALDAVLAIPRRFAVADQEEASRRWPGGDRQFRRLRARYFDIDAYTNFL
jgi:hypothetical protein